MKSILDHTMRIFNHDEFHAALTQDHIVQLNQLIEEEQETIMAEMLPFRDQDGYEQDFDHYLQLNNSHDTPAFPGPKVFLVLTVIYRWMQTAASPVLRWHTHEARVFDSQGDMEMFKFKEAMTDDSAKPIFN